MGGKRHHDLHLHRAFSSVATRFTVLGTIPLWSVVRSSALSRAAENCHASVTFVEVRLRTCMYTGSTTSEVCGGAGMIQTAVIDM